MIKTRSFIFTFYLFIANYSISQVELINTQVLALDARIESALAEGDPENSIPCIATNCRLTRRAIGTVDTEVKIYFMRNDGMYFSEEEQRDIETFQAIIQKAEILVNTGSYQLKISYYFDEKGELIYLNEELIDSEYGCSLIGYYFKQQRIVGIQKNNWACDKPRQVKQSFQDKISVEEQMIGQEFLKEVGLLDNLLAAHYLLLIGR